MAEMKPFAPQGAVALNPGILDRVDQVPQNMAEPDRGDVGFDADEASSLDAVWAALHAEGGEDAPEAAAEAPETAPETEAAPDEQPEGEIAPDAAEATQEAEAAKEDGDKAPIKAPTWIPDAIKTHWGDLTEDQRAAIETTQQEFRTRLGEAGRDASVGKAISDAAERFPAFKSMAQQDRSNAMVGLMERYQLAQENPAQAVANFARDANLDIRTIAQAMGLVGQGQAPAPQMQTQQPPAMTQEQIDAQVQRGVEKALEQDRRAQSADRVASDMAQFAKEAPTWSAEIEQDIGRATPAALAMLDRQRATAMEGDAHLYGSRDEFMAAVRQTIQPMDVVKAAYTMVTGQAPEPTRAPQPENAPTTQAAPTTPPVVLDPGKVKAAKEAQRANITGGQTGAPRQMSEDEAMQAAWNKLHGTS